MIATLVCLADWHARGVLRRLTATGEALEPLAVVATEDCAAKTDLGVGEGVLGRTEAGSTYRAEGRRVPLVRGSFFEAAEMIDHALRQSAQRLGLVLLTAVTHALALAF